MMNERRPSHNPLRFLMIRGPRGCWRSCWDVSSVLVSSGGLFCQYQAVVDGKQTIRPKKTDLQALSPTPAEESRAARNEKMLRFRSRNQCFSCTAQVWDSGFWDSDTKNTQNTHLSVYLLHFIYLGQFRSISWTLYLSQVFSLTYTEL